MSLVAGEPLVVVRVDERVLSLWGAQVVEVLRMVAIQPLGEVRSALLGAIDRRGEVVTVFDLRRALDLPARPARVSDLLIVLDGPEGRFAVPVDAVSDIVAVDAQVRRTPRPPGVGPYVAEVVNLGDRLLPVLDLDWLVRGHERALAGSAADG